MKQRPAIRKIPMVVVAAITICFLLIYSPFSAAEQRESGGIIFIIGNREDESPISGVEIEIHRNLADGTKAEKIGNFTSRSERTGEGLMSIDLEPGSYSYRVVTEGYRLTGKEEWETFQIEGDDKAVLLWVRPKNGEEETVIEDEEVAKAAPKVEFNTDRKTDEMYANAKGNAWGFQIDLMRLLDISNNVWLTLGFLASLILGVIGLDYLLRLRKH